MIRYTTVTLALCAAIALAAAGPAQGTTSGAAASAASAAPAASASATKTRAQTLRACLKKANRRSGAAKRRARAACRRRFGTARPPAPPATAGPGPVATDPAQETPQQQPPPPSVEPVREYEGIAYIYKSVGPWQVIEGNINGDSTKANGTIQSTRAQANFAEEVGKVQTIQIGWVGDQVTITHPEIGTNAFTRQVKEAPCTQ